jgi:hypothetical protein
MLAQNFLTAEDLCLTEQAHAALIKVLHLLDCGELKHVKLERDTCFFKDSTEPNAFNMASFECGTAHCIGGWARVFMDKVPMRDKVDKGGLYRLFYPPQHFQVPGAPKYHDITAEQAACALRSYLITGQPHWEEAFKLT